MAMKNTLSPFALALGASLVGMSVASAQANPFSLTDLGNGYQIADTQAGDKKADGKCGGAKKADGKCGEGKCGGDAKKAVEGKCGEGKCGGDAKKAMEGKCGGDAKKAVEGKCGEGKCGGSKK
ncbi:MAG: low-complexity protein [Thiotrichales bacterium]